MIFIKKEKIVKIFIKKEKTAKILIFFLFLLKFSKNSSLPNIFRHPLTNFLKYTDIYIYINI